MFLTKMLLRKIKNFIFKNSDFNKIFYRNNILILKL